jgi:excisionase family DNA binding protein
MPFTHPKAAVERRLCSPAEAAKILDVHVATVWRGIKEGWLDSVHVGVSRKIPLESIDRLCSGESGQAEKGRPRLAAKATARRLANAAARKAARAAAE